MKAANRKLRPDTRKPEGVATMNKNCIAILEKQDQPTDVIRTLFSSGMGVLVIRSFLVKK
jgi:hypothetical protein